MGKIRQIFKIYKGIGLIILIMGAILLAGSFIFLVNQAVQLYYNSEFLLTPCELCAEANPHLESCIYNNQNNLINEINLTDSQFYPSFDLTDPVPDLP